MEEEKLLYPIKTAIFSVLVLAHLSASSLNTSGFQTLKSPREIELAKSIDDQFKKAVKEKENASNSVAGNSVDSSSVNQQIIQSFKNKQLTQEQKDFIKAMDKKSKKHLRQEFLTQSKALSNDKITQENLNHNAALYVFITLGMKPKNIQLLIKEAKKYNAQVVIRGLKNNSFKETAEFLRKIAKDESEGVIIDPTLFKKYKIQTVPTFVLAKTCALFENSKCDLEHDLLEGNVSIQYALEKIKARGDLSEVAAGLLR